MKSTTLTFTIIFSIILFNSFEAKAQSSVLQSVNGYVVCHSSDDLNFTIRLDNPNSEVPQWMSFNDLQLLKDQLYLQIIEEEYIPTPDANSDNPLYDLQKWETEYIEKNMNSNVKRSDFMNDNNILKYRCNDLDYNTWYYCVEANDMNICFYYYDFYVSGYYIRLNYVGNLNSARLFIPVILKNLRFYKQKINLEKLQQALAEGKYGYVE